MESVARLHPDSRRVVLLLDGPDDTVDGAEIARPEHLVADPHELAIMQSIYKPIEYATAFKALLLKSELEKSDIVFFLDPDMRLFQPMSEAIELLRNGTGTVLTPHRLTPPAYKDRHFYEFTFKTYGIINTGFVGATRASLPVLDWWHSRLKRNCIDDLRGSEWVDQRVMDLALQYFDVDVLKSHAYNVGWWNLEERPLHREDGVWYVGDAPLVLMHYSGVRPRGARASSPQLTHSPANPIANDAAHLAEIRLLEDTYVEDLRAAGYDDYSTVEYGFLRTPGGRELSNAARRGYRRLVLEAEEQGKIPPSPDEISWSLLARIERRLRLMESPRSLVRDYRVLRKR
ncbi:hypothetical protein L3i23_03760 [Herbiconiux sp. L3-i23]|nr:hypothetical protein L3i23_03760 [Herbiconiux sp. L3-i23]